MDKLLVKTKKPTDHKIFYASLDFRSTRAEKFEWIDKAVSIDGLKMIGVNPDKNYSWLNAGMADDFESLMPLGSKEAKTGEDKNICFKIFSNGVKTNRDTWVFNFNEILLSSNIKDLIDNYNKVLSIWVRLKEKPKIDEFVSSDDGKISWSEGLKNYLQREIPLEFHKENIRASAYRPFIRNFVYFDQFLIERRYQFTHIFPITNQFISMSTLAGCI